MSAVRSASSRRSGPRSAVALVLLVAGCAAGPTLVDDDAVSGFALYRSGRLDRAGLAELCRQGVEEMVVLDGSGRRECALRADVCPALRLRYDTAQDARRPLTAGFLAAFDRWIEEARLAGRKVALRCRHGWHRAGRLTAWYRMRHQGWASKAAIEEMLRVGRFMDHHRQLEPQVEAMADLLAGRPCSTAAEHCLAESAGPVRFPADACAALAP